MRASRRAVQLCLGGGLGKGLGKGLGGGLGVRGGEDGAAPPSLPPSLAVRLARDRALLPPAHPKHVSERELVQIVEADEAWAAADDAPSSLVRRGSLD